MAAYIINQMPTVKIIDIDTLVKMKSDLSFRGKYYWTSGYASPEIYVNIRAPRPAPRLAKTIRLMKDKTMLDINLMKSHSQLIKHLLLRC